MTLQALKAFTTGKSRKGHVAVAVYLKATTKGPTCSDADVLFAELLGQLVDKDTGFVGQHWGWEEGQFLNSRAARNKPKAAAGPKPKAAAGPKPKAGRKTHDKSDGDEWEGVEGEGDDSEEEEDEEEDETPLPPPPRNLASTSKGKRVVIPEHRGKVIPPPPPPPPPTIETTSQERVKRVGDHKGKGKVTQSAAPKATLPPPPVVELKSQDKKGKQIADPKAKGKATRSGVPKASIPPRQEPQTSRSARRKQQDPLGVDETEMEDQHPSPPSEEGDAAIEDSVMLYDGFISVLEHSRGTKHQSREDWYNDVCKRARDFAGLD